jgi:hypothetical protein
MLSIISKIKRLLGLLPKTPNEFIEKFIKESKNHYYDLALKYDDNFVLIVEPLKFTSVLYKHIDNKIENFKNGYIVYFEIESKNINNSKYYKKFKESEDLELFELDNIPSKKNKTLVARYFNENIHYMELAVYLKEVLDRFCCRETSNSHINLSSKKYY